MHAFRQQGVFIAGAGDEVGKAPIGGVGGAGRRHVDVGDGEAEGHGGEKAVLLAPLEGGGAGIVGHVGVARGVDHGAGGDAHRPLLCRQHHPRHTIPLDDGIRHMAVEQVGTADLVQGVHHGDLQVFHVAHHGVVGDAHRVVAVSAQLGDEQLVHGAAGFALGSHLVDGHPHAVRGHAAEKAIALQQEGAGALAGRAQGGADPRRPPADDHDIVACVHACPFTAKAELLVVSNWLLAFSY